MEFRPQSQDQGSQHFALIHFIHGSLAQPFFPDTPSTDGTASDKDDANVQCRSGSLAVAITDNLLQMWF
jgi:hypothetical protein